MNSQGKTVTYKGKKVDFSQPSKQKRTEAITAKGQKATGVSGKNPNIAAVGKGIKAQQRSQRTLNALEKAAGAVTQGAFIVGGGGAVAATGKRAIVPIAKKIGGRAFDRTASATYTALSRNIAGATGKGGKVSRTMTPFGPTLRSTSIGTEAQQAARIGNLEKGIFKSAVRAGRVAQTRAVVDTVKAGNKAVKAVQGATGVVAGLSTAKKVRGGKGTSKKK